MPRKIADASADAIARLPASVIDYSYLMFPVEFLVDGESLVAPDAMAFRGWVVDRGGRSQNK
jgi:hypothetical protein